MKRCVIVISDAGPFNSLWVADRLDLLLALEMPIVVVDAVYDEMTSDTSYPKDRDVKAFIDANSNVFIVESTATGEIERERRESGAKLRLNAGEIAMTDFMTADDGLRKYVSEGDPVAILFEDSDVRVINRPPNLHLLSTAAMLRGFERVGVISSASEIIYEMTHPSKPDRRPADARSFTDLPDGVDEPATIGSMWEPSRR